MDESINTPACDKGDALEAQIYKKFTEKARKQIAVSKKNNKMRKSSELKEIPYIRMEQSERYGAPIMHLDVERYIHMFDGFDLSEKDKLEILQALWDIMCRFAELGFGLDGYTLACEQNERDSRNSSEDLLE